MYICVCASEYKCGGERKMERRKTFTSSSKHCIHRHRRCHPVFSMELNVFDVVIISKVEVVSDNFSGVWRW